MKVFFSPLLAIIALTFCFNAPAQDIIYTISGEIDHQTTTLDSISVENLTKQSSFGFGELPERDDYRINLSRDEYWGSTSVSDMLNQSGLQIIKNLPGNMVVGYRGQKTIYANISLHNANGQRLTLKENQVLESSSLVEVEIGNAGIYFLTISSPEETRSFKVTGLVATGNMSIATQSGAPIPLKSGQAYTLAGTEKGDNVKVSVFKLGYVAQPVELVADENETLVFPLEAQTPPEVQTLAATNIVSNSATLNGNVLSDGNSPITERGFFWSSTNENPGEGDNKIIVEGATGCFSAELSGLELNTSYYVRAFATNSLGTEYGEPKSFTTHETLCNALDNCDFTFSSYGYDEWFIHSDISYYGGSSVRSGKISYGKQSILETSVTGPGILSFYWKISTPGGRNKLSFYIGSKLKDNISRNVDWQLKEYDIPEGTHTIKWVYSKNYQYDKGWNCGWIDKINFILAETTLPIVTTKGITSIGQTMANSGGEVISTGFTSTTRGVCWNTTGNPTIFDNNTNNGTETEAGLFTSGIIGLTPSTTYYVRAYATNNKGTTYGEQVIFKTLNEDEEWWQRDTTTIVEDIYSPATGETWMDRNMGACHVAITKDDEEAFGDLYQWGRATDGHQKRNTSTTQILSNSISPEHEYFILTNNSTINDWHTPQNDNLWQGFDGINNPCPKGYRLPTEAEFEAERKGWHTNNREGAFASPLKIPMAGFRGYTSITMYQVGVDAKYWTSTIKGSKSTAIYINNESGMSYYDRASGFSVRCIKD